MASDADGSFSPPAAPPGSATSMPDVPLGRGAVPDDQKLPKMGRPQARSPFYGVLAGLLFVIGDARLYPNASGLGLAAKLFLFVAAALGAILVVMAWRPLRYPGLWMAASLPIGLVLAGISGDWFPDPAAVPAWRDAIVPALDVAFLVAAAVTWYAGRERQGQMLLVMAMTATALIFYGQQDAPTWAMVLAVAATWLFLAPSVSAGTRVLGIALHALALLGIVQGMPSWFTWSPFPFLSLMPVFLIASYYRERGGARTTVWWSGIAVGAMLTLLGTSTSIGNMRIDAPLVEPLVMLGMGIAVLGAFMAMWWQARRSERLAAGPLGA